MAYRVIVMPAAQRDLEEHADLIADDSKRRAQRWLLGAWEKIFALSENPNRFSVIAESEELGTELRDVIHSSHRIVYRVRDADAVVAVIRVWHMSRHVLMNTDLHPDDEQD